LRFFFVFRQSDQKRYSVSQRGCFNNVSKFNIGKNRKRFIEKFDQNSLVKNWTQIAPIYIHHGTEDDIIYYDKNVEVTIKNWSKNGSEVSLRKYEGQDYYTLALLYQLNIIKDFETH